MAKINLLPKNVAELIAAGEVVERPASVIKELMENSIDAGATKITVEIKNGGVTYMRVTDNGCAIYPEDVPTAFLRHATSKIKHGSDLDSIATLGFRGEALAAVSSVARVEMLTKPHEIDMGTRYVIEGGEEIAFEEAGCPNGTIITICDIFFNTPARMKFLKKDITEGNAVAAVVDRVALSHPEVAVKFIRDNKTVLSTSGNGKILDAVYSVCGKEFANTLIPVEFENAGVKVSGLTCKPIYCKPTKAGQYFFLNNRFVKSGTVSAALEQAYKNSAMIGRFPSAVLNIEVPFSSVDVNVHPAKTEVRFSDEKRIFDAVYYGIKNAVSKGDERPSMYLSAKHGGFARMSTEQYKQTAIPESVNEHINLPTQIKQMPSPVAPRVDFSPKSTTVIEKTFVEKQISKKQEVFTLASGVDFNKEFDKADEPQQEKTITQPEPPQETVGNLRVVGEVFYTYIITEKDNELYFIDKHAAHERILFEQLKKGERRSKQYLLANENITLDKEDYSAIINANDQLSELGFEIEDLDDGTVMVRAVPSMLIEENIEAMICEIAETLRSGKKASVERMDDIYHRIACRAAVKSGNVTTELEAKDLANKVLSSKDIMYCPHGRPVAVKITQKELEKQFGRIQ